MARRKIKIKRIENATSRQVTFSKRRGGLMKKAHDLSVLCDAEVAVIIFSSKGKLFEFASSNMSSILDRYLKCSEDLGSAEKNNLLDKGDGNTFTQYTENLRTLQRNFLGEDLERLSLQELLNLEHQINDSLGRVRSRKGELLIEELEDIKEKMSDARKTTNANSSFLAKLVDSYPSDGVGSHYSLNNSICTMQNILELHRTDALQAEEALTQLGVDSSEHDNPIVGAYKEARWSIMSEDLNRSPRCVE